MQNHIQAILLIKKQILSVKTFLPVHNQLLWRWKLVFYFPSASSFHTTFHPLGFASKQKSDHEKRESYSSLIEIISL